MLSAYLNINDFSQNKTPHPLYEEKSHLFLILFHFLNEKPLSVTRFHSHTSTFLRSFCSLSAVCELTDQSLVKSRVGKTCHTSAGLQRSPPVVFVCVSLWSLVFLCLFWVFFEVVLTSTVRSFSADYHQRHTPSPCSLYTWIAGTNKTQTRSGLCETQNACSSEQKPL